MLVVTYCIYLCVIVFGTSVRKYMYINYYGLDWEKRHETHSDDVEERTPLIQKGEAIQLAEQKEANRSAELFKQMSSKDLNNGDYGSTNEPENGPPTWQRQLSDHGLDDLVEPFAKNKYDNPDLWEALTIQDFKDMGLGGHLIAKFRRYMNKPEFQRGVSLLKIQDDGEHKSESEEESESHEPEGVGKVIHFFAVPLETMFEWTCPDCELGKKHEKLYLLTFFSSFLWVTIFSFVLSSVIERWVKLSGVPMTFFGLVLVSLGAEIPDTIESVTVAKRGYGSMAVSNCQGTQVINICLGLGLPWLITVGSGNKIQLLTEELLPPAFIQCVLLCINLSILLGCALVTRAPKAILNSQKAYILIATYVAAIVTFGVYLHMQGQI